ncbi:hypothetical protein COCMIDRAFT_32428 [Bipolaris oryzae ATCC 44560]|uniref:MalT-like TPR region domain-containing protein n=1 Tax=Bipolaris oryzae ATCC 44560 TaxID=930090 RepID=W6ZJY5_COCMI|nr:uncharacterized protein COCMIDRAFT_32428 [Bipolaris oryzae ATCC 44560]EUC50338.1 hypothetical protein COCMIDRAFT_32428 [Bipolaris oryzae ATCC 44560]
MEVAFRDNTRYKGSANAVATTWVVSFSQLRERDTFAADLLEFISCIEWKAVPWYLLPKRDSEEEMENAIGTLCRREEDHTEPDEEEWYDTHRLVHLATRIWFNKNDNSSKVVKDAIRHVAHVFPFTAYDRELIIWRAYLPHSLRLLNGGQHCNKSDISELCLRVGICLGKNGRLRESLVWVEKACQQRDHLSEDDPERLASQYHLAIIYTLDRQMENSILLLERIVQVRMKTPYSERPSLLASLDAPARAYALNGQGHKAREILERVVEAEEKTLPPENYQLLLLQQTLARAYEACNQMHKAVPLHEKVVRTREKILAPGHPDILHAQHTLARSYLLAGQEQRAVPLLEQVIDARDTTLSSEHPNRREPCMHAPPSQTE